MLLWSLVLVANLFFRTKFCQDVFKEYDHINLEFLWYLDLGTLHSLESKLLFGYTKIDH